MPLTDPRLRRASTGRGLLLALIVIVLVAGVVLALRRGPSDAALGLPAPTTELEPRVAAAIDKARIAVRKAPTDDEAWGVLGETYQVHELRPEAITSYRKARQLAPGEFRWAYFLALALVELGEPDATETLEAAVDLRPEYAPALIRFGEALIDDGDLQRAEAVLNRALELDEDDFHGHLAMARVAERTDRLELAREHLRQCERINPRSGSLYALASRVERRLGNDEGANFAAERAQSLPADVDRSDPALAEVLLRGASAYWAIIRGNQALAANRIDEAERLYRIAVEARPDVGNHWYNLGNVLQRQGRLDEAQTAYETAVEKDPEMAAAFSRMAIIASRRQDIAAARDYLGRALAADPNRAEDRERLARLLVAKGAYDAALEQLDRLRTTNPDGLVVLSLTGICRLEMKETAAGLAALQRAADLFPDEAEVWLNLARARLDNGERAEAEAALDQAETLGPALGAQVRALRDRMEAEDG